MVRLNCKPVFWMCSPGILSWSHHTRQLPASVLSGADKEKNTQIYLISDSLYVEGHREDLACLRECKASCRSFAGS